MLRIVAVFAFALIFSSCANKLQLELERSRAIEETLFRSNDAILASANRAYVELEQKLSKAVSAQHASVWWPKAQVIKEKTKEIVEYIESLNIAIENGAGLKEKNGKVTYKEENFEVVKKIFSDEKSGEDLLIKLKKYKQSILDIENSLQKQFGTSSIIISKDFDLDTTNQKDFALTFFGGVAAITAKAMLLQFENNVRIIENKCVTYCNYQVSDNEDVIFDRFSTLIGQSSNYIKAGNPIEISAGVGSFSTKSKPVITIDGKTFQRAAIDAVVSYKFKTPLKAGKYSVPIKIEYTDDRGTRQVVTKKVEYTVVE